MPTFSRGTIVSVPFPYTKGAVVQRRPALVISYGALGNGLLLWVLMITSAANRGWPGDVEIGADAETGLPVASLVRTMKVATIEAGEARVIGMASPGTMARVDQAVRGHMGLA